MYHITAEKSGFMARKAPGKAHRKGLTLLQNVDMFRDEDTAYAWLVGDTVVLASARRLSCNQSRWKLVLSQSQPIEMGVDPIRYLPALRQVVLLSLPHFMEPLHRLPSSLEHRCLRQTGLGG